MKKKTKTIIFRNFLHGKVCLKLRFEMNYLALKTVCNDTFNNNK